MDLKNKNETKTELRRWTINHSTDSPYDFILLRSYRFVLCTKKSWKAHIQIQVLIVGTSLDLIPLS